MALYGFAVDAWNEYDPVRYQWSGWSTSFYHAFDLKGPETGGSRLCVRIKRSDDYAKAIDYYSIKFSNITETLGGDGTVNLAQRTYGFDPTTYGSNIPSGDLWTQWVQGTSASDFMYAGGGPSQETSVQKFLNYTGDYLYLLLTLVGSGSRITGNMQDVSAAGGKFKYQDLTMSIANGSVFSGGQQIFQFGARGTRRVDLRIYYGNTLLQRTIIDTDTATVACQKSWFTTAGVTALTSITLLAKAYAGDPTPEAPDAAGSFTLNAGEDMKPVITEVRHVIEQQGPACTNYPTTYLKGISKTKVSVFVSQGSNAAIQSVSVAFTGSGSFTLQYNSETGAYEGISAPVTASNGTVMVTDQRGLLQKESFTIGTVHPYVKPTITVNRSSTYRCNSSGAKAANGTYFKALASAGLYTGGELSDNAVVEFTVESSSTSGGEQTTNITSGTQTAAIETGTSAGGTMYLTFALTDRVGYTTTYNVVLQAGGETIMVAAMKNKTTGAIGTVLTIGKTPQVISSDLNYIDVAIPLDGRVSAVRGYQLNGMNAGAFQTTLSLNKNGAFFSKDFLNIDPANPIRQENATEAFNKPASDSEWTNIPGPMVGNNWSGIRFVFIYSDNTALVVILEFDTSPGRVWTCGKLGGSWGSWKYLTPTAVT